MSTHSKTSCAALYMLYYQSNNVNLKERKNTKFHKENTRLFLFSKVLDEKLYNTTCVTTITFLEELS